MRCIVAGVALSRYLSSLFFTVRPASLVTYFEVSLLMLGIALVAYYLPAACVARVNPMVALRRE